jgi:hypothetical protein
MDRKSFAPVDFKLSESGDVTVAFSRFNVKDHDGDVTRAGALPVGKAVPLSAFNHSSWDGVLPTGSGVISEKGDLGILDGRFFMETDQGRNTYHTVKAMADLQEWSYGYVVLDGGPIQFEGKSARELRKLDVFEVSPVLKGAGLGTATIAIKGGTPGPEMPYADHLSWVHDQLAALIDRTDDRIEWRAKAGRALSAANREMLTRIRDGLMTMPELAAELSALLDATNPTPVESDAEKAAREVWEDAMRRYALAA